jgi:hypothetical protein
MDHISAEERLLQETQAACLALFIHHIRCSHLHLFSDYLLTIITLWDLGYKRLVRRHCTTCYILFRWLLRAEDQIIE